MYVICVQALAWWLVYSPNDPGDLGSIPDRVIPLDAFLINTQHYKVRIKGEVERSSERNSELSYTQVL